MNRKESVCKTDDDLHYSDYTDYTFDYTDYTSDYTDYTFWDYTDYTF